MIGCISDQKFDCSEKVNMTLFNFYINELRAVESIGKTQDHNMFTFVNILRITLLLLSYFQLGVNKRSKPAEIGEF